MGNPVARCTGYLVTAASLAAMTSKTCGLPRLCVAGVRPSLSETGVLPGAFAGGCQSRRAVLHLTG